MGMSSVEASGRHIVPALERFGTLSTELSGHVKLLTAASIAIADPTAAIAVRIDLVDRLRAQGGPQVSSLRRPSVGPGLTGSGAGAGGVSRCSRSCSPSGSHRTSRVRTSNHAW
jgi:formyltetrahydrofolate synthetase